MADLFFKKRKLAIREILRGKRKSKGPAAGIEPKTSVCGNPIC